MNSRHGGLRVAKVYLITPEAQLLSLWVEHNEPEANRGENHGKKTGSISERHQFARSIKSAALTYASSALAEL
ncbi:MAG: hypothetical protein RPU90_00460 [Candidatus Sedimenticola sp. (ex Thyasira tokunagai)]